MTKISALSDIGTSVASNDAFVLVDVSDPTTPNKKIQQQNLFLIPDGSVATPGLRFLNDTDTGIYRSGSNTLGLVTGASARLFINSSGLVGIGTSSVNALLEVNNSTAGGEVQRIEGNYDGSGSVILTNWRRAGGSVAAALKYNDDSSPLCMSIGTTTSHQFRIRTADTDAITIDTSQRVGIGTTSPQKELQINATTPTIRLEENGGGSKRLELSVNSSAEAKVFAEQSGSNLLFGTVGTERARIDSSGRLLVSTASSLLSYSKLQVQGGAGVDPGAHICLSNENSAPSSGSNIGSVRFTNNAGGIGAILGCEADGAWTAGSDYRSRLLFSTTADGASSPTERMRIESTGRMQHTSSIDSLYLGSTQGAGTSYAFILGVHSRTGPQTGGTNAFLVYTNGNVENTNNSYAGISDLKLKENIVNAGSQWDDLKALQVRKYNFKKETGQQTHTQIGLVAQEVELVSPGLVSESPDRDEDGNDLGTVTKSVNYSVLYIKAVKALQEALERIETLEAKVAALETP
jgi:hypothetical protein